MSARSAARRASVQNHPRLRRRSSPAATRSSTTDAAAGPEEREVVLDERQLLGRGAQVRAEHEAVVGVEDGRLHGLADQRLGVVHQVGVERVVAGHQHAERVAGAAAGPAELLPERRPGAREAGHHHRVEAADVDAELERVGGRQPEQLAAAQPLLEVAPLLGEVAAAVGRHPGRQRRVDLGEQAGGGERDLLRPAAGPDERQRPDTLDDEVGQQVGRLGRRRSAGPGRRSRP